MPLTNAERQARRKRSGPRPPMGVTISRWVQAATAEQAEARGILISENVEHALISFYGEHRSFGLTLTDKGADILGQCTVCKLYFLTGDRVRRDGEFARHEECQVQTKHVGGACGALRGGHACTEPVGHKGRYHVHRERGRNLARWPA